MEFSAIPNEPFEQNRRVEGYGDGVGDASGSEGTFYGDQPDDTELPLTESSAVGREPEEFDPDESNEGEPVLEPTDRGDGIIRAVTRKGNSSISVEVQGGGQSFFQKGTKFFDQNGNRLKEPPEGARIVGKHAVISQTVGEDGKSELHVFDPSLAATLGKLMRRLRRDNKDT